MDRIYNSYVNLVPYNLNTGKYTQRAAKSEGIEFCGHSDIKTSKCPTNPLTASGTLPCTVPASPTRRAAVTLCPSGSSPAITGVTSESSRVTNKTQELYNYLLTRPDGFKTLEQDVFQFRGNTPSEPAALTFAGAESYALEGKSGAGKIGKIAEEPDYDSQKIIKEAFEEIYGKYYKTLNSAGVKDIPKPDLKFDDTIDDIANYSCTDNALYVNLRKIKECKTNCFLADGDELVKIEASFDDGTEVLRFLFSEVEAKELAQEFPECSICTLDKDGAQMRAKGTIAHEMSHWMQIMSIVNNPETYKKYLEYIDSFDTKLKDKHFFKNYKPSGALLTFERVINGEKVVFTSEDMLNGLLRYPSFKFYTPENFFKYYSNPMEIVAYADEVSFLIKQKRDGFDENKLYTIVTIPHRRARVGHDILCGVIQSPKLYLCSL